MGIIEYKMLPGVIPLCSTVKMNGDLPNKFSIVPQELKAYSNTPHRIPHFPDTFIFETIIIPQDINLYDITKFIVTIGGDTVWDIPFELLLDKVRIIGGLRYIQIPNDLFHEKSDDILLLKNWGEIPIGVLPYCDIQICLVASRNFNFSLILQGVYYEHEIRGKIAGSICQHIIYQYQTFHCGVEFPQKINPLHISNALYVKTCSPITNFKLHLNNILFIDIDSDKIEYYGNTVIKNNGWTNSHTFALKECIGHKIPRELVEIIESYCKLVYTPMYLYKFLIGQVGNTHITDATINFNPSIDITVDIVSEKKVPGTTVYVKNKNILICGNGVGRVKYPVR
jgi:hypothetical protein